MSTKTSIKRIAAVAAVALTLGGFSAVSAFAAPLAANDVTALSASPYYASTTVGTAATNAITWSDANDVGAVGDAVAFTASVSTAPTGSVAVPTLTIGTASNANYTLAQTSASVATATIAGTPAAQSASVLGTLSFNPDVPGKYKIAITPVTYLATAPTTAVANTGIAYVTIYATGTGASVAASGIGTATVSGVAGGQVVVNYAPALASNALTANTLWTAVSSGTGSITTATGNYATVPTASAGTNDAMTAVSSTFGTAAGYVSPTNGSTADYSAGVSFSNGSRTVPHVYSFTASSSVAGTQTIVINQISATTGAPTLVKSITITWNSTSSVSLSSLSTAYINTGATYAASNGTSLTADKSASGIVANIGVTLLDGNGSALLAQKLTVTVAGPGTVGVQQQALGTASSSNTGLRAYTDTSANSSNTWQYALFSDGTAGTTTITIADGTTIVATKTFTFTGSVAAIKVTQKFSIAKASSTGAELGVATSNTSATTGYVPAIVAEVNDANANDVAATLSCLSSDLTVISSCVIVADNNATYGAGTGFYNVDVVSAAGGVSGKSATVTVRYLKSDGTYISATPVTFTLGGSIASTTVALDQATYTPGQPMQLTITAKDSAGNPTYDNQSIAYAISANLPVGGALPATSKVFALGKYATSLTAPTLFAPSVSGPFTVTVLGNDLANTATSVSAAVTGGESATAAQAAVDAANEATDAANAATDAANNAMDSADAAQQAALDAGDKADAALAAVTDLATKVSAIASQIATLSALVKKIAAKVKA